MKKKMRGRDKKLRKLRLIKKLKKQGCFKFKRKIVSKKFLKSRKFKQRRRQTRKD